MLVAVMARLVLTGLERKATENQITTVFKHVVQKSNTSDEPCGERTTLGSVSVSQEHECEATVGTESSKVDSGRLEVHLEVR